MLCVATCRFLAPNTPSNKYLVISQRIILTLLQSHHRASATFCKGFRREAYSTTSLVRGGAWRMWIWDLQRSLHHPRTDLGPVMGRHKNVILLLYLDFETRTLTGLWASIKATLRPCWKVTHGTALSLGGPSHSTSTLPIPTIQHPGKGICLPVALRQPPPLSTPLTVDCLVLRYSLESCLLVKLTLS